MPFAKMQLLIVTLQISNENCIWDRKISFFFFRNFISFSSKKQQVLRSDSRKFVKCDEFDILQDHCKSIGCVKLWGFYSAIVFNSKICNDTIINCALALSCSSSIMKCHGARFNIEIQTKMTKRNWKFRVRNRKKMCTIIRKRGDNKRFVV